jgi:hypothetical protein
MAFKDINWKQFFIEKGERVGLAITAVLMVALTVVSLFLPNHGFLVPSPTANAKALNDVADQVDRNRVSAKPTDADKPPPIPAVPVLFENAKVDNYKDYEVALRWLPMGGAGNKRRMPELFQCDEGTATVAFSQIRSYILDSSQKSIMVHSGAAPAPTAAAAAPGAGAAAPPPPGGFITGLRQQGVGARLGGPVGGPGLGGGVIGNIGIGARGGPVGGPGLGGGALGGGAIGNRAASALRAPTVTQGFAPAGSSAGKTDWVDIDKISENSQPRYAETVRPLRQAIIVATFPYRKEILEFQRKLHLESIGDVLSEAWEEPEDGEVLPSFRFLGVDVERREIDPEGKPGQWRKLDLSESLREFVKLNGRNFEPEPPGLEKLKIDGLVMPLLVQFKENRYNHYPQPEMELANIRKTLKDVENKKEDEIVTHVNPINSKDPFNPFRPRKRAEGGARAPAAAAPGADFFEGGDPRSIRGGRPGGRRPGGAAAARAGQPGASAEQAVPEHVLVRVVDVNIEPGKVYEYRLHVRMANPNYRRISDVLSPSYAVEKELQADKELKDSDWFVVPKKVSVPPEFYYYAVDQKELDGDREYRMQNRLHARDNVSRDQQAVFQIHRWLENASQGDRDFIPVGEWAIAERVIVPRGEYVGRAERVDVPIWNTPSESFILAQPTDNKRRRETGIEVNFSLPNDDAILVDFEGGPQQFVRKSTRGERPETVKLDEKTSTEVLLVSSDGRVSARNAAYDAANSERVSRLDSWHNRVSEVRAGGQAPGAGPMNPFAPGGGRIPGGAQPGGAPGRPGRPGAGGPTVN